MRNRTTKKIDYRALADFRYEIRRFVNFSRAAALAAGIEPQQHQALLAIKGQPEGSETTVGVLAERLQIRHHSAVELSRRLQAHGWVRRSKGTTDGRVVDLLITSRGEKLLERLSLSHRDELRTAGPRLLETLLLAIARRDESMASADSRARISRTERIAKRQRPSP
jgi:DNA-binding MarR family transcriptional regulator